MKKYLTIIATLGVIALSFIAFYTRPQQAQQTTFSGFSDPFLSIQLATSPSNGNCLTTDGTNNSWSSSCGGGSNPFTNSSMTVPSLGTLYTSATTSALSINSLATTTIGNLGGTYYVPPDFSVNGCAGNASYTDFGQCVNGLYSLASTSGNYIVTIKVPSIKVPSAKWTTPIDFDINGLGVQFQCDRGATLIYGGTGTSTTINTGNPTGHYVSEISGCNFQGNDTLIAAAQSNSKVTGGIALGGNNGAVGVNVHDNNINGFGINVAWGGAANGNAYMINLQNNSISGGNGNMLGNSLYIGVANNSGERNNITGNSFTDPSDNIATSSIYIVNGATASNYFGGNSFDNTGIYCGSSNGVCTFVGNHFENPGSPSSYPQYIPIFNPSSDGSTSINLIGNEFANSASNQTWETIIKHGGQLYASGNRIDNYNGFTVTNFSDHSNNNGQSSDHICQTQVQGGSLTNIVAGGGGTTWSLTNGVPCVINRANSYSWSIRPLSTNVNQFVSGNSIVADVDHSGNWNLGEDASNSTITVNKNLSVDTLARVGTTTSVYTLEAFSSSAPQLSLSAGAGLAKWTARNAGGNLYFATTTVAGTATTTTSALSILNTGEFIVRGIFQFFSDAGTKIMEITNAGVATLLGTWDFSGATVKQHTYSSFTYATSTAWTATTTIPLGPAYTAESWSGVKCFTDTGTLNVSFNDGTNRMNMFNASTTVGTVTLSTNNTFTSSEKRYVDIGTPASSPTKISCTVDKIVNN